MIRASNAIEALGMALEPVVSAASRAAGLIYTRTRIYLIRWELDSSRKFVEVLEQRIKDGLIARREFPLYQVQIDRQILKDRAQIGHELHQQADLTAKLRRIR